MARKRRARYGYPASPIDSHLNFIIILALAFFLIVAVFAAVNDTAIRTRANIVCGPTPTLPATSCSAGWQFERDDNGCPVFQCPSGFNPQ